MRSESRQEAKEWLARADRDLLIARRALEYLPSLSDQGVFHAHQAAEKSLKALLAAEDQEIPRTHDLVRLVNRCAEIDKEVRAFEGAAQTLNPPYATQFRYPGESVEPEIDEAHEAITFAETIRDHIRNRLDS